MLTDGRLTEFRQKAADVIAEMDDALDTPAFRMAVAVLAIAKDRDEWKRYAERLVAATSVAIDAADEVAP